MSTKACKQLVSGVRSLGNSARWSNLSSVLVAAFGDDQSVQSPRLSPRDALDQAITEVLEDRKLMSTVSLVNGVLTVDGAGDARLRATVNYNTHSDKIRLFASGADDRHTSFPKVEVREIRIVGTNGNDRIRLARNVDIDADVEAGEGDDVVVGGAGDDVIDAGAGNDRIVGGKGNDLLAGGSGRDRLVGNDGDDTLRGEDDADRLLGGDGNDDLQGGAGKDLLVGGEGNDRMTGGTGRDRFVGGKGTNTVVDAGTDDTKNRPPHVGSGAGDDSTPATDDGSETDGSNNPTDNTSGGNSNDSTSGGSQSGGTSQDGASQGGNSQGGSSQGGTSQQGSTSSPETPGSTSDPIFGGTFDASLGVNAAPKPVLKVVAGSQVGLAQHTVNVNATSTQFFNGDAIAAKFEWDFGDVGSAYNKLIGWTAAHTYNKPGTYTIKLTVTDVGGKSATTTTTVTIAEDTRKVIYVDSVSGNDGNDGSSDKKAVRTLDRAVKMAGNDTKILLKRGETFDVGDSLRITGRNMLVGAYGSGTDAPRVRKVGGTGNSIFYISPTATGFIAQNLTLDSIWDFNSVYGKKKIPAEAFTVSADNFTVRDSAFMNINTGVQTETGPTGVLVQNNYFSKGIRSYCIWAQGYDHAYLGNTMTDSQVEHLIRADGLDGKGVVRVLIYDNDLSRTVANGKGSIEFRTASWYYISGNHINGGTFRIGLQDIDQKQFPNWASYKNEYGVLENNLSEKVFINVRPGTKHVAIRNNVVKVDNWWAILVECVEKGYDQVRKTEDIRIQNNTVVSMGQTGSFLWLHGKAKDMTLQNNLYVAPNLKLDGAAHSFAVQVSGGDLSSFKAINGNVWPSASGTSRQDGLQYVGSESYDSSGYRTEAEWEQLPQVGDDSYRTVQLSDGYRINSGKMQAGSTIRKAA